MVSRPRRPLTLAGQLLALQSVLVLAVLLTVAGVSLAQSQATFVRVEGRRIAALAEQAAANPLVRSGAATAGDTTGLATFAHTLSVQADVTDVVIADASGRIVAATDPRLEGRPLPLGSPRVAGGAHWYGRLDVESQEHLVAQVPVLSAVPGRIGEHLGTLMVTNRLPSVAERLAGASSYLVTYLGIALLMGTAGSWLLARRIKRQTRGMEPGQIAALAEYREAVLHGIAEGVVALDPQHRITLANDVATELLGLPGQPVGVALANLGLPERLDAALRGEPAGVVDEVVIHRGRVIVLNTMRIDRDRLLGTVTTMRDRTELTDLEREIGSFRSTAQLLRAQTHEFANQLHTISGLIQIGEFEDVVRYVATVSQYRHHLDVVVNSLVRDPAVSSLLMAKAARASELRVSLRVDDASALDRLEPADSADVATVLGNLVDNALEAAAGHGDRPGWVEVLLRQDPASVEIMVTDSGPGVPEELREKVFEQGVSTKADGRQDRGIGLALSRLICRRRGGEITVERGEDGARFVARLRTGAAARPALAPAGGVP